MNASIVGQEDGDICSKGSVRHQNGSTYSMPTLLSVDAACEPLLAKSHHAEVIHSCMSMHVRSHMGLSRISDAMQRELGASNSNELISAGTSHGSFKKIVYKNANI